MPLQAIDEAVTRIRDGSITKYVYDPKSARWVLAKEEVLIPVSSNGSVEGRPEPWRGQKRLP